jgi:hypothetical protein
MKTSVNFLVLVVLFVVIACAENNGVTLHLNEIDQAAFHTEEIIPAKYNALYGKWKLVSISGGFSGMGIEPNFDYLEIKKYGIYGLVRDNELFEYGKVEIDTFDINRADVLQVRFVPESYSSSGPAMSPPKKYVELRESLVLDLNGICCDMYNYHFKKAIQ